MKGHVEMTTVACRIHHHYLCIPLSGQALDRDGRLKSDEMEQLAEIKATHDLRVERRGK